MRSPKSSLQPFGILTVIIGVLNAFYIIYSSNVEKRKKYTIYKSIGYTSGHLVLMNVLYVSMIVLISIVVELPVLIIFFPKVMVLAMSTFGFAEYRLEFQTLTLAYMNITMLLFFIGAALTAGFDIRKNYISQIMNE